LKIIPIGCDDKGNIMLDEVEELGQKHAKRLSCIMITYPSTHGVFEKDVKKICDVVHKYGGQVYMDGANMNAQPSQNIHLRSQEINNVDKKYPRNLKKQL